MTAIADSRPQDRERASTFTRLTMIAFRARFPAFRVRKVSAFVALAAGTAGFLTFMAALPATAAQAVAARGEDALARDFAAPPASARPWVYAFWINGNITKDGITADLEAMQRAGIGGMTVMEVCHGAPQGPVAFMDTQWRELFKHLVTEAGRLGLEVNMNNDAGWEGSGGPWIQPAEAMQTVVWSETEIAGATHFAGKLPQPTTNHGYYRDIAVLAMPTPGAYRIVHLNYKSAILVAGVQWSIASDILPPEMVIPRERVVDLTDKTGADGALSWDPPAGQWTVMRIGHTATGAEVTPAPAGGCGLECDKLSKTALETHFNGMIGKLVADTKPFVGKSFVATHIDSWENGSQNWTLRMREEFRNRRGYDLVPYLPVMSGRVVESLEVSERFLHDLRQTISDLVVENYAGHFRDLAHRHGLRFTVEAYGCPCEEAPYAGRSDEPMCEFWIDDAHNMWPTVRSMASAAHTYGKPVVAAEAFTALEPERWLKHPATLKALGDKMMCEGVNRFVFHRYAMQPWLNRTPGSMMGPWGLHYERTQTWWEQSRPWHEYLARCHHLLRQGLFVADVCHLFPGPNYYAQRSGYDYDTCSEEVLLTRMQVKDGRLLLPDGMSYRVLVLPNAERMNPEVLRKIGELAHAGATIIGPPPTKAISLTDYPHCDATVKRVAGEIWAGGKIITGKPAEQVLAELGVPPDFQCKARLNHIHRTVDGMDVYFVANPQACSVKTVAAFRVAGKAPELWWPETGGIEQATVFEERDGLTHVALSLEQGESVFVVFRKSRGTMDPVLAVTRDAQQILPTSTAPGKFVVTKAVYGPPNDPARTRDVREMIQRQLDSGETEITVSRIIETGDPAPGVVKTLSVDYDIAGKHLSANGTDLDTITLADTEQAAPTATVRTSGAGGFSLTTWESGHYEIKTKSGRALTCDVPRLPPPQVIGGPWQVRFDPARGGPAVVRFERLDDWSQRPETGIKYYSGTAAYRNTFVLASAPGKNSRLMLDLGKVAVIAEVRLNGKDLGILWKPPFRADVTDAMLAGENTLEIRITNLPVNRMIGDELLPEDSERTPDGALKQVPQWVLDGKPSPTGRFTFATLRMWKKDEPLQESGMLGPVTLQTGFRAEAAAATIPSNGG